MHAWNRQISMSRWQGGAEGAGGGSDGGGNGGGGGGHSLGIRLCATAT